MSFKDFFKEKQAEEQRGKTRFLSEVKDSLNTSAEYARGEIKNIDTALIEADRWIKENLVGVPSKELPDRVNYLLSQLEQYRGNPGIIRGALNEFDRLTLADVWGNRPDGEPDRNRAAAVKGYISKRLHHANGCAAGIRRILDQLKAEIAKFEEERVWQASYGAAPVATIIPPEKKVAPITPIVSKTVFDARAPR